MDQKKVAIVGMGCRFPGNANNVDEYWEILKNGTNAITEVPKDRWSIDEYYHPNGVKGKTKSKWGGFISDFDKFDAKFFGINAREVEQIDPQQRQALEIAWEAFEDAGIKPESLAHSKTGVFVGGFTLDYKILQFSEVNDIDTHATVGSMMNMLSNRISYVFDLMGPSMTIDTACSSSLVALHQACKSINNGECDLALSGGIELIYTPEYFVAESTSGMLSEDGQCKTFDETANGYVRGEGGGFVVLKSLEKAIANGDFIYAIVRESLVNQDGKTNGITVPNKAAQKKLLEDVYKKAEVYPNDVHYLELHGTGTSVGDPIEANAVGEYFGQTRSIENRLVISSVKANIGHLEASSGIASIIKVACILNKKEIVPHIGMKKINPKINLDELKLRIPLENERWPENQRVQLAGINSFGFGGTNAHIILEGYENKIVQTTQPTPSSNKINILPVSAKSEKSLDLLTDKYLTYLTESNSRIEDICFSAINHREKMPISLTVVGETKEEMISNLKSFKELGHDPNVIVNHQQNNQKVVFIFTGMGPQWYGMGRELYHTNSVFKSVLEDCHNEFSKYLSWSLLDEFSVEEHQSKINNAEVSQPLNFAVQVALYKMWVSKGVTPDAIVGHSVGEVAALYCAGVYSFEDAVKISYVRSSLQQKLTGKGVMLAVSITEEEAKNYINGKANNVSIAAINSYTSLTLSGEKSCLEKLQKEFEKNGVFNKFLKVNVPYHSPIMNEIKEELLESLKDIQPKKSKIRIYTTADGKEASGSQLDNEYWWKNVANPVYFAKAMSLLLAEGYTNFVEIGPHPVLGNSVNELAFETEKEVFVEPSIRRMEPENRQFYQTYATLYTRGVNFDLNNQYDQTFNYVKLPHYAWNHERYWNEPLEHMSRRLGLKEHKFLGYRLNSFSPTWKNQVNDIALPFVKDHCVNGKVLIAGAHYIETSFQVMRTFNKGDSSSNVALTDIKFNKALFMDENNICTMLIQYDTKDGQISISDGKSENSVSQNNYFSAYGARASNYAPLKVDLEAIKKNAKSFIEKEKCYFLLDKMNFNYGPMFQGLKNIWLNENEVVAELCTLSELGVEDEDTILHPVILDAAFQSFLANQFQDAEKDGKVDLKLPESISSIHVSRKMADKLYVYSKVNEFSAEVIKGDIKICDENGIILVAINDFVARTVEKTEENALISEKALNEWFYGIDWLKQDQEEDEQLLMPKEDFKKWIILADSSGKAEKLAEKLGAAGKECVIFSMSNLSSNDNQTITVNDSESYLKIAKYADLSETYGIVYLSNLDVSMTNNMSVKDIEVAKGKTVNGIRYLISKLTEASIRFKLWVITNEAVQVKKEEKADVLNGSIIGMLRVIGHSEFVGNIGACIDVDTFEESLDNIICDLIDYTREDLLAYRNGQRYVARLNYIKDLDGNIPVKLSDSKIYIVTGALGSLGQITINWMCEKGARNFVMIGRTKLPSRVERKNIEPDHKLYNQIKFIDSLERKGCRINYVSLDITDEQAIEKLIEEIHVNEILPVGGCIHIAGVVKDKMLLQMNQEDFDTVYDTKVKGAWLLSKYLWEDQLDFFIMYSSTGSVVTAIGQANYAAANSFMDTLAAYRTSCGKPGMSLGWGPWGIGMVKEQNLIDHYKYQRGMNPIYAISGMQALERIIDKNFCHVVIGEADWPLALNNYVGKPVLYNHLAVQNKQKADNASLDDDVDIFEKLGELSNEEDRKQYISEFFTVLIAETLHMKKEEILSSQPINAIGVDSIIATDLRNRISKACHVNVSIVDILGGISIDDLVEKLFEELCSFIVQEDEQDLEALLAEIENLSEEEAMSLLETMK